MIYGMLIRELFHSRKLLRASEHELARTQQKVARQRKQLTALANKVVVLQTEFQELGQRHRDLQRDYNFITRQP